MTDQPLRAQPTGQGYLVCPKCRTKFAFADSSRAMNHFCPGVDQQAAPAGTLIPVWMDHPITDLESVIRTSMAENWPGGFRDHDTLGLVAAAVALDISRRFALGVRA